jgi:hypothetical protein
MELYIHGLRAAVVCAAAQINLSPICQETLEGASVMRAASLSFLA